MKKIFLTLSLALVAMLGAVAQDESKDLTLMSYNIRIGIGMDSEVDLSRIGRVINHVNPDIVGLQEVDSMNTRTMVHQVRELAKMTGMHDIYAPAIPKPGGGKYGIAFLSKEKPLRFKNIGLPGKEELRTVVFVEFEDFVFINTHFSLTEADRLTSVDIILEEAKKFSDKPVFLSGDLNARPDSEPMAKFKENFTILSNPDILTFPSDKPRVTLDYIMYYNNDAKDRIIKSFDYIYDEPLASDHLPVVVGVRIMPK